MATRNVRVLGMGAIATSCLLAAPALAHHPFGGMTPQTFVEGFLSGVGHPVVGLDHLAFVVALGLLASLRVGGWWVPLGFLLAAIAGTGLHLSSVNVAGLEIWVALSVLALGVLLLKREVSPMLVLIVGAIAGVFHGYAYGETVIGAEQAPIGGYLLGFTLIQYAIALGALALGRALQHRVKLHQPMRIPALVISAMGAAFLAMAIAG
ncbi:HupE/UreJ family protein [Leptolyngbya sp. AN02str]|uniref:HupE/UreJ family protein n=1 Tax=Leptolyngbya sp. AN02str TaxID=3423363 RepID=UPI003D31A04B